MGRKAKGEGGKGGSILVLLVLLTAMMCGGAWNYQRNLKLESEQQGSRPFKGYSDEALDQLLEAYEQDAVRLEQKYRVALGRRTGARRVNGLIDERIGEFERVQRQGEQIRIATAEVAERDARVREIREEQSFRGGSDDWMLHVKRLTNI